MNAPTMGFVILLGFTPLAHAFDLQQLSEQLAKPQVIHGDFIQEKHLRALPKPLTSTGTFVLAKDFPPVVEDRALEAELRLCLSRIAQQHWRLHA